MWNNFRGESKLNVRSSYLRNRCRLFTERLKNGTAAIFRVMRELLVVTSPKSKSPQTILVSGKSRTVMKTTTTTSIVVVRSETTTTTYTTTSAVITTTVTTPHSVTTDVTIGTMKYSKSTIPSTLTKETTTAESTIITTTTNTTDIFPSSKSAVVVTKSKTCTHTF